MTEYEMMGESFLDALCLERAEEKEFCGVVVYRLWGTETQIQSATNIFDEMFSGVARTTLRDAVYIGSVKDPDTGPADLYELIVMRQK